jgi:hypothetical protein
LAALFPVAHKSFKKKLFVQELSGASLAHLPLILPFFKFPFVNELTPQSCFQLDYEYFQLFWHSNTSEQETLRLTLAQTLAFFRKIEHLKQQG